MDDLTDGLHDHTKQIQEEYPEPLSLLLIELAERNREHWLEGPKWKQRTIGAECVRETGLTNNQIEWADQITTAMGDN